MEYTENCRLPQWAETDRILMKDFNEAMARIDEHAGKAYTEEKKPYVCGSVDVPVTLAQGGTVLTFDFEPHHVLIGGADVAILRQGGGGTIHTVLFYSADNSRVAAFYLQGNKLTLGYFGNNVTADITISYVAYR